MTLPLQFSPAAPAAGAASPAEPLYLVDGHSLTFKAYYAVRGLTAPDGTPVGAVYGFLRMLLKLIDDRRPASLAVVFDTGKPTFRKEIFPAYKANREAPPPDFGTQMDWIYRLLKAMGFAVYEKEGFEADDLIATMAAQATRQGREAVIVSADKDLFQLVNGHTRVLRFGSQDLEFYDPPGVEKKMGVRPEQMPDYLAIVGDSSDNIPGVPSIGPKGAVALLQQFGSLDAILSRTAEVKNERQRKAIESSAEQARLSRKLATVVRDVPFHWADEDCRLPESPWNEDSIALLARLGFNSIIKEKGLKPAESAGAKVSDVPLNYRMILDADELRAWAAQAAGAEWLAIDTETTGVDPMRAQIVGVSLSTRAGEGIYIPLGHRVGTSAGKQMKVAETREILRPLFAPGAGRSPALSAHHAKYDWKILERAGFAIAPPAFDTMLASFVLDPGKASGHGLKALAAEHCGMAMHAISEIIGEGKNSVGMDEVDAEGAYEYACRDADATLRLTEILSAKLKETPSLQKLFAEIEIPLIPVLHRMEMGGFAIDPVELRRLGDVMSKELERLCKEIWAAAGRQFNIDSPKQVAQVLFEELMLPPGKKTRTGYSTDNEVLEAIENAHPIVKLILEYRGNAKLKSTYADALPKEVHPATKRIHTSFNQTIAQTGRLSSTNPNLQNIPIRTELGRAIRRAFIPDAPDHVLLSADYSQIELRILAHFCRDEALMLAYAEGRDIHALTASRVFGIDPADVSSEMRAQAKMINFGIIYGISAHGLAQRLQIPRGDAKRFIDAYFAGYPRVREWIDATLAKARETGYVETLMGRRRLVPDVRAANGVLRGNAERIAINTPIQGTSADMIKMAMIDVDKGLERAAPGARMACQVHDELVFSVPESRIDAAKEYVRKAMAEALPLSVPIVVDVSVAKNWADC